MATCRRNDIGAHVGFYSLLAAVLTRPGGKVCAFEPLEVNAVKYTTIPGRSSAAKAACFTLSYVPSQHE